MRRESDHREGLRTGVGRRVRDRLLAGQTATSPVLAERHDLKNLILFLSDDLRESALAVGGIEAFLLKAQTLLEKPDLTKEELRELVDDDGVFDRFDLLHDAVSSLRQSMARIHDALAR